MKQAKRKGFVLATWGQALTFASVAAKTTTNIAGVTGNRLAYHVRFPRVLHWMMKGELGSSAGRLYMNTHPMGGGRRVIGRTVRVGRERKGRC